MTRWYKFVEAHPSFILSLVSLIGAFVIGSYVLRVQVTEQRKYFENKIDTVNINLNDKILQSDQRIDNNFKIMIGLMKQSNSRLDELILSSKR